MASAIIGEGMLECVRRVQWLAEQDLPVLIVGETGTGKELLAHAYIGAWRQGSRASARSEILNCAHFDPRLFRSELFGYRKGAFTGANKDRPGLLSRFDLVCLDELGATNSEVFPHILRLADQSEYLPVGGEKVETWNGRLLATTNAPDRLPPDLRERFHEIDVPPLRERPDDIISIIEAKADEWGVHGFTYAFVYWAADYAWPGNVRELLRVGQEAGRTGVLDIPAAVVRRHTGACAVNAEKLTLSTL